MAQGMGDITYDGAPEKSQQVTKEPFSREMSQHPTQEPCYFLTLAREIRDMIYGYVLINEHTIEPYPAFLEDERKPIAPQITSLLRTNKLISAEARHTLYSRSFPIHFFNLRALLPTKTSLVFSRPFTQD